LSSASAQASLPPASPTSRPQCLPPSEGTCLGQLKAGTYTSATFRPAVTFTVGDGWSNFEDTSGNFKLVAPGSSIDDWLASTADYIALYTSIAPAAPCAGAAPGLKGANAMVAYLVHQPALAATLPKQATVSGLSGAVLDIRLTDNWKKSCFPTGPPTAFVVSGLPHPNLPRESPLVSRCGSIC